MYTEKRLTLAELESLASLGLSWFLAFYGTRVASHETFLAQSALVLGVNLNQRTCDSESKRLGLSLVTTALDVDGNVIFFYSFEGVEGLLDD